ncbi:MAG TPA: NPCBM/NEW2 domain-containing protein [Tepidisphaeraceae bacterium]|nr:NPCBM/NEW2 domain-containing protein [Tepidisphaeraceae bacterium]
MKTGRVKENRGAIPVFAEALESRRLLTTLPSGFLETRLAQGLESVTAMTLAPDGRVFVSQQNGVIRVIKDGQLLDQPFASLSVGLNLELGLHSLAFDPNFAANHYIFAFLTTPDLQNVIVRLTADGDAMVPGSQTTIFSLDALYTSIFHQGGAMKFMPDGTLLISNGDEGNAYQAQLLGSFSGKMIRINTDGSIPTDNPFYNLLSGDLRSIWALGLRNPYTFDIQPGTGRILISDVGENTWEEINEAAPGANFGWATTEGNFDPQAYPDFTNPLYVYPHVPTGGAITGGAFYNPADPSFGSQYVGDYFFCDFVSGWIKALDFSGPAPQAVDFATGISGPQFTTVGPDGSLYYLEYNTGSVWRVQLAEGLLPAISNPPEDKTVSLDEPATFNVTASGPDITYQWQRDDQDIDGATDPAYTLVSPAIEDDGAQFRCVITNQYGTITSDPATLTVLNNHLPSATILTPADGSTYIAGDTIDFSGEALDAEDGALGAAAFTWKVEFHHHTHIHPFIPDTSGISSGSFIIPTNGETDSDVWYRIILTVQDSAGGTRTVFRDITPITSQVTLSSNVPGLQISIDSQPQDTPYTFTGVAGIIRAISAPASQVIGGQEYDFIGWSDGGAATHDISTPASNANLVATYVDVTAPTVSQWTFGWDDPIHPQSISAQFSEEVSGIDSVDDISIINADTLQAIHPVSFSYDHDTHIALFIMPALIDANYSVTLPAGAVQDGSGNLLEEASTYGFFVLGGDANHDRAVDLLDMMALSPNWFSSGATFSQGDFNYDGSVNAKDLSIIARNYQQHLDPPQVIGAVSWDGGGDGTSWTDPLNWSNDQLPAATDIVTIASGGGVTLSGSQAQVKELHSSVPLSLDHATLTVGGDVTLDADTSLQATTLNIDGDLTLNATLLLNNGYSNPASRLEFFGSRNRNIKGAGTINSQTDDNLSSITNSTHDPTGEPGLSLIIGSGIHIMGNDLQMNSTVAGGTIVNNGTINLGSDHTLNISGDFSQTSAGTINTVLAGTNAGTEFGQIVVSGNASIDGTLSVALAPTYDPDDTVNFPIIVAAAVSGTFATFTGGPTPSGRSLQMQYTAAQAIVDVAPVLAAPMVVAPMDVPPAQYLSDLTPVSAVNGFGSFEKDHSNGGNHGNDGKAITLNGKSYAKGLGVHAGSTIIYNLNGQSAQFTSDIGVDDEAGNKGSVTFQVLADNKKIYDSGRMTGSSATKSLNLDVSGKKQLKLVVTDSGNGKDFDHADWAGARLINPPQPSFNTAVPVTASHAKKITDLISTLNS